MGFLGFPGQVKTVHDKTHYTAPLSVELAVSVFRPDQKLDKTEVLLLAKENSPKFSGAGC